MPWLQRVSASCTNEGNADMGTSQPKLQITAFGLEKIVPDRQALGVFTRLLARSATGQPITTYTSHYGKPRHGGEFHIIIVDNGRSRILGDADHRKTLNCLRCGACMNTCPVYRRSGGYSYTYFVPGPIGINLGMLKDAEKYRDNVSACSFAIPARMYVRPRLIWLTRFISGVSISAETDWEARQSMPFRQPCRR